MDWSRSKPSPRSRPGSSSIAPPSRRALRRWGRWSPRCAPPRARCAMPLRLNAADPGFDAAFAALVEARREADADVSAAVTEILADVRARGDAAVAERTLRFDGHDLDATGWQIDRATRR